MRKMYSNAEIKAIAESAGGKLYKQVVKYTMDETEYGPFMFITTKSDQFYPGFISSPENYAKYIKKAYVVETMQTGPDPVHDFSIIKSTEVTFEFDENSSVFSFYPGGYKGSGSPYAVSFPTWVDPVVMEISEL